MRISTQCTFEIYLFITRVQRKKRFLLKLLTLEHYYACGVETILKITKILN